MNIGDVVIPIAGTVLASGSSRYHYAIVANLNPFALVSGEGDMLWAITVEIDNFYPLCQAAEDLVEMAVKRYGDYIRN